MFPILDELFKRAKLDDATRQKIRRKIYHELKNPLTGCTAAQEEQIQRSIGGQLPYKNCPSYDRAAYRCAKGLIRQSVLNRFSGRNFNAG